MHPPRAPRDRDRDAADRREVRAAGVRPPSAIKGDQHAAHHVAWSDPIELWRVKRAARRSARPSTTCSSARSPGPWRGSFAEGDAPDEVHALVPFNLRPLDEPLPRELGNRFGLVLLGLPVGIADPVERTLEVKRRMDAIKHGHEGAISYGILELMGRTPCRRGPPDRLLLRQGSMVLTNVPGPRRAALGRRDAARRRARVGAVLGQHRHEREHLQLRRQGDRRVPHRCRSRPGPAVARRRARAEALALARLLVESSNRLRAPLPSVRAG